jgi:hypothetical protein
MGRARRIGLLALAVTAAACSVISGLDEFELAGGRGTEGGAGSTGGAGGQAGSASVGPGAGGSAGSGGAGTSSAGGSAPGAVYCGQQPSVQCGTGEVCCFNKVDAACDTCSSDPQCAGIAGCDQMSFAVFACDDGPDCAPNHCCLTYVLEGPNEYYEGAACQASCNAMQHRLCRTDADCDAGQVCVSLPYPNYNRCQ